MLAKPQHPQSPGAGGCCGGIRQLAADMMDLESGSGSSVVKSLVDGFADCQLLIPNMYWIIIMYL